MTSHAAEAGHAFTSSAASVRSFGAFGARPAASGPLNRSTPAQYLLAIASVAAAVALRAALHPVLGFDAPLLVFVLPTVLCAALGTARAALLATALGTIVGAHLFIEPAGTFWPERPADQVRLVLFVLENLAIVGLISAVRLRRARLSAAIVQDSARLFGTILDTTPHAIIATDYHGRVTAWNAAATRMFGFSANEVIGNRAPHIPPEGRATYEVQRARALHGERFTNVPITRCRKDGTLARCEVSVAPMENNDRIVGTVATLTEVAWHGSIASNDTPRLTCRRSGAP